jgi:hypothetical protein
LTLNGPSFFVMEFCSHISPPLANCSRFRTEIRSADGKPAVTCFRHFSRDDFFARAVGFAITRHIAPGEVIAADWRINKPPIDRKKKVA